MPTVKRKTEVRQDEIARAAMDLISARGMKGLRMAAVARIVGIVPSGIYRHYRNKDELLDAILDYIRQRFGGNVRAVARLEADAPGRLHALLEKHTAMILENRSIPIVIFSAEVYGGSPARRRKLLDIIGGYLAEVAQLVRQGQREGSIRKELDPDAVATLFLGLVQPSAILWHLSGGEFDVAAQAAAAWPLFHRAIRTTSAKETP